MAAVQHGSTTCRSPSATALPLLLRLPKAHALSSDAPIATRSDAVGLRLKVTRVFGADEFADFDLRSHGVPPFNAFVNLKQLQQSVQLEGRGNLLLSAGMVNKTPHAKREKISDALAKGSGRIARWFDGLPRLSIYLTDISS